MFPVEPVPEQIGAYQVIKHVGRVGAADVYIARMDGPLGFSRDVTLKLVNAGVEEDARFAEDLAREASICARLNHPVVVRMFDFFDYGSRLVLVLEQVEGCSLDRLTAHLSRRKQKLGDAGIFYLASQLGAALAHAHGSTDEEGNVSPVIHRDIKPENILVSWDGHVRLAGFGLGKILGRTPDSIAGTVRGTPGFMSPEQARGERATVRSDVYGFGALLWSLLTGLEPPTDGAKLEPLAALRSDLPRELLAAVDAALEPSADKRRITCAEISQWLGKLTKPEAGREELRQKVLWLRATRGPASKVDTTNKAPRMPKRRQAVQATRPSSRRPPASYGPPSSSRAPSQRAPGSLRVPPSSQRPGEEPLMQAPPEHDPRDLPPPPSVAPPARSAAGPITRTLQMKAVAPRPTSNAPTARPTGDTREGDPLLRLPPPPPLPNGPSSRRPQENTAPSARSTASGPATLRPSSVSVRTVTSPPAPRTMPPLYRRAVDAEDMLSAGRPLNAWDADVPVDVAPPAPEPSSRTSSTITMAHSRTIDPSRDGPDTVRPVKPTQMTFTLTTQLLLAALTAALVVTVGLLLQGRSNQQAAAPTPPQVVTVEVNRNNNEGARASDRERSDPPSTAPTSVPADPPVAAQLPAMPDPSELPDGMAYLTVKGPDENDVYMNGVRRGPTNETMVIPCGSFFMRLAPKDAVGFYKAWTSPGQTVVIECRTSQTVISRLNGFEPPPRPMNPRLIPRPRSTRPGVGL